MAGGFWNYAREDPDALAVVDPDGTEYSAGEVAGRSHRMVHALRSLGLEVGDTVAAVLPNGINPVTVYLGALESGLYYVPINYRLSAPEVAYILSDSEAKAFISHARFAELAVAAATRPGSRPTPGLRSATFPGSGDLEALLASQPTDVPTERTAGAAMHYTSGTTGRPKGVKRKLTGLDADLAAELFTAFFGLFGIPPRDDNVHLCTSPNYHTAVTTFAGNALQLGPRGRLHGQVGPRADAGQDRAVRRAPTPTWCRRSSTGCSQLPDDVTASYDVSSMRWAIHAAAPCPVDVKRQMLDWWGPVI